MGDTYWNQRQASLHESGSAKRPRSEFDRPPYGFTGPREMHSYPPRDEDWAGPQPLKDTKSLGSAYDHYLRNSRLPSEEGRNYSPLGLDRAVHDDLPAFSIHDSAGTGFPEPFSPEFRGRSSGGPLPVDRDVRPRESLRLPPDASNTLYVEGIPANCTKREVAHIFRPFVGYKEVRIVRKESKHRGGDPVILSFVDFVDEACAATALSVLQGYVMDEHDPESPQLRLQFSKFPGPRSSASAPRWRR